MSGGDRDESEDTAGDLRRTESDSVLKKVSISGANYSSSEAATPPRLNENLRPCVGVHLSSNINNTIKMNLAAFSPSSELAS